MACLTLLFVLCAVLRLTAGYSIGAGASACTFMTPNHGTIIATGKAPYRFTVTQTDGSAVTEYSAGQTLRGTRSKILYSQPFKISREFNFVFQQQSTLLIDHINRFKFPVPCAKSESSLLLECAFTRFIHFKHKTFKFKCSMTYLH